MNRYGKALVVVVAGTSCSVLAQSGPGTTGQGGGGGPENIPQATCRFVDVTAAAGLSGVVPDMGMGTGIAAEDFDEDGDIDLFVPTGKGHGHKLFRNNGDGTFTDIAPLVGLDNTENGRVPLWIDFDGDQLMDLIVGGDCFMRPGDCLTDATLRLYRQNVDGTFTDVSAIAGIWPDSEYHEGRHRSGMCAGDLNGDGYLDLYTGIWFGSARILMNNRDSTFTDASESTTIGQAFDAHWQGVMHDFNRDGLMDIFAAIDFDENKLWINNGDGTFRDIARTAGVNFAWNSMGVAISDADNDGDMDLYVTEVTGSDAWKHNLLLRNDTFNGNVRFTEISEQAGVNDTRFGWGDSWADLDRDGRLDLVATNGFVNPPFTDDRTCCFINARTNPLSFVDRSNGTGLNDRYFGSCLLSIDYDRDGDLDIVQATMDAGLHLYQNTQLGDSANHNYIVIQPRINGTNHWAIGTVVRVKAGGKTQSRLITAGMSQMGQEPAEAFFGLGANQYIQQVTVEFPDGRKTILFNLPANHVYEIR